MRAFLDLEDVIMLRARRGVRQAAIGLLNLAQAVWQIPGMVGVVLSAQSNKGIADRAIGRIASDTEHLIMVGSRCWKGWTALHPRLAIDRG